jgi:anti-sigma factor RsiW
MRHVTDGELHAYLDGALDALPTERAEEIRSHLGTCPVCQERLQDGQEIRATARDLLSSTAPPEVAPPPFEELRDMVWAGSEAGAPSEEGTTVLPSRRWKPLRGLPLAWAATVVLALGVGWMGGQVWQALPTDGRLMAPAGPAESPETRGPDLSSAEATETVGGEGDVPVEDRSEGLAQGRAVEAPPTAGAAVSEAMIRLESP